MRRLAMAVLVVFVWAGASLAEDTPVWVWDFFEMTLPGPAGGNPFVGIEADVILFRPYDDGKWGFDAMDAATNDRFVRYVVARLAAYRNVWWSHESTPYRTTLAT